MIWLLIEFFTYIILNILQTPFHHCFCIPQSQIWVKMHDGSDYELQMLLMKKLIGNKENPLTIDEIQEELSLKYLSLSLVAETIKDIDLTEETTHVQ
jgi:hypothetical protein